MYKRQESDRASLKAALQKLEAVVLKSEDTTRATADSLNAYTAAHKAGEEEIEKAKTILNDKNAKKITVAKLEQALFNARILSLIHILYLVYLFWTKQLEHCFF